MLIMRNAQVCLLAAFVFLIFGILGLVLFMGMFYSCNADVANKEQCLGTSFNDDGGNYTTHQFYTAG